MVAHVGSSLPGKKNEKKEEPKKQLSSVMLKGSHEPYGQISSHSANVLRNEEGI